MPTFTVDALPVLFEGGISNYVRPLLEHVAAQGAAQWQMEFVFRLGVSTGRLRSYRRYRRGRPANVRCMPIAMPDRLVTRLWERGVAVPRFGARGDSDVFLATTELVPALERAPVGCILYDLCQLRIPQFFDIDVRRFKDALVKRVRRARFIVAISQQTKADVVELLGYPADRIVVIYPGIRGQAPDVPRAAPPRRRYILYLGALSLNKNVDGMLRVFARCVHEHDLDLEMVLTGKDFCGGEYWHRLVNEQRIENRVRFAGWVTPSERDALIANATMLWQFSWYEGFGLPVLEAAARGTAVLYSERVPAKEILRSPEQEIDPSDEEACVERAAAALNSPQTLAAWRARGLEMASRHTWQAAADRLLGWLEGLT
ncbi:MAG: glycosyltransferase family 4 protein [Kiritimatiellae bacterium]|nr:glycosyltransferase family 4 protein [Kiritimatiellia bacterium]